jgi:hypothetical protein
MNRRRTRPRVILGAAICVVAMLAATLIVHTLLAGSGEPDVDNRFPNAGAIVVTRDPNNPEIVGSGVLIHPRVLLTAGHVTATGEELLKNGVPLFDISRISFGTDAYDPSTWVESVAILTHPGFFRPGPNGTPPGPHDLGVVILKEPVNLPCATLAYEGFLDDLKDAGLLRYPGVAKKVVAVGYGNTLDFPPAEERPADGLRRFSFPDFHALVDKNWIELNQNLAAGNTGVAGGDSGGPLFWLSPNGELVVVAVHSGSDPQRVSKLIDYRTDTAVALEFIDLVIEMVEVGLFD